MKVPYTPKDRFKVPPALGIRLNQALFETTMMEEAEAQKIPSMIKDFNIAFKDDGVHVTGKLKKFIFTIPFDALVDFEATDPDTFLVKIRGLEVYRFDLKFLTPIALRLVRNRLDKMLNGLCKFTYLGKKEKARALKVKLESNKLIPAFPDMHLVDLRVKDGNFLLRLGKVQ
jgi:hypothetical protein